MTPEPEGEKKESRGKQASSGAWNWLKSKRGSNALLATIAGAVATGLAVAGIIVPLNDLKQRMGVVESHGKLDPVLDHLEAVDDTLAALQKGDAVGAVAALAPKVQELAGQVGDIKAELSGAPDTTTTTPAATLTMVTTTPTGATPSVLARLDSAETKLATLAKSLAAEQETTQTLSATVASVRADVAAATADLAAKVAKAQTTADDAGAAAAKAQAAADTAQAAANAAQAAVDAMAKKLSAGTQLPTNANGQATWCFGSGRFTAKPFLSAVVFDPAQNQSGGYFTHVLVANAGCATFQVWLAGATGATKAGANLLVNLQAVQP